MTDVKPTWGDRLATYTRATLLTAIAVIVALLIVGKRNGGMDYPLTMDMAQANGIAATPGYLALNTSAGSVFYIIDTNKQVICTYKTNGGELRLVSARKFDYDGDIPDGSLAIPVPGGRTIKALDGSDGLDRATAKEYSEGLKKMMEAAPKK
jgi:hypothetical protein